MGQSRRGGHVGSRVSHLTGMLLGLVALVLPLARLRVRPLMDRSPAGIVPSSTRDSAFSSLPFIPGLLAAPFDPEPRQNPKLTALLDDLARAVPQQQGAIPLGTRVAPPLGFSIEAMPKSVRDAHRSRMLRKPPEQ